MSGLGSDRKPVERSCSTRRRIGFGAAAVWAVAALVASTAGYLIAPAVPASAATTAGANPADCPGGVLAPHAPITINTDADWTAVNGVTGGSGTAGSPYVISCWSITATTSAGNGITVASAVNAAYVIREVAVSAQAGATGTGISVAGSAASTATVEQTTVSGFATGIQASSSGPVVVDSNRGSGNGTCMNLNTVSVTNNVCVGSTGYGFSITGVTATGNDAEQNHGAGFLLGGYDTVSGNTINGNGNGIQTDVGGPETVNQNTIVGNRGAGIDISNAQASSFTNNTIEGNGTAAINADAPSPGFSALDNVLSGNHIGGSPFGIVFGYGDNNGNLVTNTDWTDGHQSIVRFTNQNTIVDAGSAHLATTDQPVFFHDYIAALNITPGPTVSTPSTGNPCASQGGTCGVQSESGPTVQYAAATAVHWDFGDGQSLDLCTPGDTSQCSALVDQGQGPEPDVTHTYASTGSYTATLTVTATTTGGQSVTLTDSTPVSIVSSPAASLLPGSGSGSSWPMLGNSPDRPFFNGSEAAITSSNANQLVPKWRFPTNFSVTASPAVATVDLPPALGGAPSPTKLVFDGAFDGEFYAINASTGLPVWSDCLVSGPTDTAASCDPQYPGNTNAPTDYGVITASPEVVALASGAQEVLAAANATMYGLDAATGKVLWSFNGGATGYTGEPTCPQVPGQGCEDLTYEIESSPVVVGNTVLFGIDCNGMCQKAGGVYAIDARDGHMVWFFDPGAGQAYAGSATTLAYNPKMNGPATEGTCGGVWSSPAVDTSLGLVYASTANCPLDPIPAYQEGAFALNLSTGQPLWDYQPRQIDSLDMDFGATPNVFQLGSEHVVGFGSKDGTYTLVDAATGAVKWSTKVALGGSFGGFYNATTDGTKIYLTSALSEASAAAATPVEEAFKGREYALDARTGNVLWRSYAGAPTLGQNGASPGVYFTGGLDHLLHAWDTTNGNLLTTLPLAGASSSGPAIAGGEVFIGAGTGATFRSAVGPCDPLTGAVCPPAPVPVGEYGQGIWAFCLASNPTCAGSIASAAGQKHPTKLTYTGAASGDVDDPVTLSATLDDTTNPAAPTPVANESVTLDLYNQSCAATTDSNGNVNCTVTPEQASGSYTASATFLGDSNYQQSSAQAAFTLNPEETTLSYTGPSGIRDGGSATLSGVLKEDGSAAIDGRAVTFTLGSGSGGSATCTINGVVQPPGAGPVSVSFAGDNYYRPSAASSAVTNTVYTGSSGAFVIGDGDAAPGDSVTYWGNDWSSANTLSGGTAPSGFKGYATSPSSNPPACGGTWTSPTGNSSPPSSVPAYMAVIVTSKITLPNSTTAAGNVVEIVAVATKAGYTGKLNQNGTGTVLGVICKS
jgi:outer membrane protein assembly factor BamB